MRWSWIILPVALLVAWFMPTPKGEPLLSGPPQFIILGISVALAAYLRQVRVHARELRDKIRSDEVWNLPPEEGYAKRRMLELDNTSEIIARVSPTMLRLVLFVSARAVADGILRIYFHHSKMPRVLHVMDVALVFWLLTILAGLAKAHFRARDRDRLIDEEVPSSRRREHTQTTSKEGRKRPECRTHYLR